MGSTKKIAVNIKKRMIDRYHKGGGDINKTVFFRGWFAKGEDTLLKGI